MLLDMPSKRKRIATLELPFRIDPSPKSSRISEAVRDQAEPEQSLRITAAEIRNDPLIQKALRIFERTIGRSTKKAACGRNDTDLPLPDLHISREAYRIFTEQGLDLRLGARVIAAKKQGANVVVDYQDQDGTHTLTVDKLIVASGRKPNTENLTAPEANLLLDETGYINVDENCRTNLPGVYAIGDLNLLGPMLAHKGIEEGNFVAESCAGLKSYIHYDTLPSVIYTDPEIAWVGQTEQTLKTLGIAIKVGIFALNATARAQATGKTEGLIKIITEADTDKLLGVHIIGHQASELIAEAVLAMEFSASGEDLARTIHAHPTVSEAFHDVALVIKQSTTH